MRSSEGGQLFPRKKKRKIHGEKLGNLSKLLFFFFSRHQTESKRAKLS